MTRALVVALLATACGSGGGSPEPDAAWGPDADLADDPTPLLAAIPGLTVVDEQRLGSVRFYHLVYEQPVDHARPDGPVFGQHVTLLHRARGVPTVLATNGYYLDAALYQEEPTALLQANQIAVEHRFFAPSIPEPADWSFDTIEQAAGDHHRIVVAFRSIYTGTWISSGVSKGGMTAIYHRRFHPEDVDGTVAYVAPISFGAPDDRYLPFFDTVGDAACRQALSDVQRELLARKPAMRQLMDQQATAEGWTYDRLGAELAFESAVTETAWAFWQYFGARACGDVPPITASDTELYGFLDSIVTVAFFSDAYVEYFAPYYYQAADELGYPSVPIAHLADLLELEQVDTIPYVIPPGSAPGYDATVMQDVADWVTTQGSELLFVYGEWDPWTAGAFELGGAADSFRLVAPEGTHAAGIQALAEPARSQALDALGRWAGVPLSSKPTRALPPVRPREPPRVLIRPVP